MSKPEFVPNSNLLIPYSAPYLAYILVGSLLTRFTSWELAYFVRILLIPLVLYYFRDSYFSASGPRSTGASIIIGCVVGVFGTWLWIVGLTPFVEKKSLDISPLLFVLKAGAIVLIVPIFEEYLMRGYILRLCLQWQEAKKFGVRGSLERALDDYSIFQVQNGDWSFFSVLVSSLFFTFGHHSEQWIPAFTYSLLISSLWIIRKDLASCIASHAATNLCLALYVYKTGYLGYW